MAKEIKFDIKAREELKKGVDALANALGKQIADKNVRLQFGNLARKKFVEMFTEEAMMRNLVKVLKS